MNKEQVDEQVSVIRDEIKKIVMQELGKPNTDATSEHVKNRINNYLFNIQDKLSMPKKPVVKAEVDGPLLTVNFFDDKGERLETLGDLFNYMDGLK